MRIKRAVAILVAGIASALLAASAAGAALTSEDSGATSDTTFIRPWS